MKKALKILLIVTASLLALALIGFAVYKLMFEDADVLKKEAYYELEYSGKTYSLTEEQFDKLSKGTVYTVSFDDEAYRVSGKKEDGSVILSISSDDFYFSAEAALSYDKKMRFVGTKDSWLTARSEKNGEYYKIASVTAPTSYSSVKNAEDLDGDPLTTQFVYSRKDAGTTEIRVFAVSETVQGLVSQGYEKTVLSYPDDGSAKAKAKSGITYNAYTKTENGIYRYMIVSPYEDLFICAEVEYAPDVNEKKQTSLLSAYFNAEAEAWLEALDESEASALIDELAEAIHSSITENDILSSVVPGVLSKITGSKQLKTNYNSRAEAEKQLITEKAAELRNEYGEEELTALTDRLSDTFIENQILSAAYAIAGKIVPDKQHNSTVSDFKLNFIDDTRWNYLWDGLLKTLEITALSGIMGVFLGAIVATIRTTWERNRDNMHRGPGKACLMVTDKLCGVYLTVIRGTPVMVQLLIMYLIIFASSKNGTTSAIVAFGINSGAYVAEIIRGGIMSIDQGQFEAGRSLGFSYPRTMIYIILPQVFKDILPALANEFIALLKETSVSGYVAVKDLNKGGEIIRSVTYSPFMPLIAVALIYLAVVMFFTKLVNILERRLRASEHR